MKWRGRRRSENVIDVGGGEQMATPPPRAKKAAIGGGLGTILVLVVALIASGGDLSKVLSVLSTQAVAGAGGATAGGANGSGGSTVRQNSRADQQLIEFVEVVLADTEDVWHRLFADMQRTYEEPKLVSFRDQIETACGFQSSAVGPFYCPADRRVYIDLSFFEELARRYDASGDFAQAYVIAHEVAHHIQTLLGISAQIHREKQGKGQVEQNRLTVRQELHADFLAGVWAHHAGRRDLLERGDLAEALNAASQIGDDTLQRKAQGYVQPEAFTHGTAAQRQRWFELGYNTGDMQLGLEAYEKRYEDL